MIWLLDENKNIIQARYSSELTRSPNRIPKEFPYPLHKYQFHKSITQEQGTPRTTIGTIKQIKNTANGTARFVEYAQPHDFHHINSATPLIISLNEYHSPDAATCQIIAKMTSKKMPKTPGPFQSALNPFDTFNASLVLEAYREVKKHINTLIASNTEPAVIENIIKDAYPWLGYFLDYWPGIKVAHQSQPIFTNSKAEEVKTFWKKHDQNDSVLSKEQRTILGAYSTAQINTDAINLIGTAHTRCRRKE